MKKVFIILILFLVMCGCSNNNENAKSINMEKIKDIMINSDYVIIDVRTKEEYDSGHLSDAINVPYDKISEDLKIDKSSVVFVYCKSGNRSKVAYEKLISLGYNVYDLGAFDYIDLPKE